MSLSARDLTFQKLSKKYHPDLNPDESTHGKFIELSKGMRFHLCSRRTEADDHQRTRYFQNKRWVISASAVAS